jgi:predicted nucleic acid-binding protein
MGPRNRATRRTKKAAHQQVVPPLVLDSGAVIALARGDVRVSGFISLAIDEGAKVFVPAVAVAETVRGRGPRDAAVNRVVAATDSVLTTDEASARTAGELLGATRSRSTIDALVVATAIHAGGARILTSDEQDFRRLSEGQEGLTIHAV